MSFNLDNLADWVKDLDVGDIDDQFEEEEIWRVVGFDVEVFYKEFSSKAKRASRGDEAKKDIINAICLVCTYGNLHKANAKKRLSADAKNIYDKLVATYGMVVRNSKGDKKTVDSKSITFPRFQVAFPQIAAYALQTDKVPSKHLGYFPGIDALPACMKFTNFMSLVQFPDSDDKNKRVNARDTIWLCMYGVATAIDRTINPDFRDKEPRQEVTNFVDLSLTFRHIKPETCKKHLIAWGVIDKDYKVNKTIRAVAEEALKTFPRTVTFADTF